MTQMYHQLPPHTQSVTAITTEQAYVCVMRPMTSQKAAGREGKGGPHPACVCVRFLRALKKILQRLNEKSTPGVEEEQPIGGLN